MRYKNRKYLVQCKYCGTMLYKTETALIFNVETKCPQCKKLIVIPADIVITLDTGSADDVK